MSGFAAHWLAEMCSHGQLWSALPCAATALLAGVAYYFLFRPLNRIRVISFSSLYSRVARSLFSQDMCETGYSDHAKWDRYGRTRRQLANEARRLKKLGDVPPVFPNGWFAICESDEIKPGESKAVSALGNCSHPFNFRL